MADHYDTAYMEDVYNKVKGGSGARLSSHGADDNHSATSTLLLAAPVFLKMAKEGKLERDIWLLHLTGEEFPADCLGARHFCECILNQTLAITLADKSQHDLSKTKITGVFVMDMIAHNREDAPYIFQISPGRPDGSLRLAFEAHSANRLWNSLAKTQNKLPPRKDRLPGKRSPDGISIPDIAMLPEMEGEIRVPMDPTSTLYNTDAQIFSDTGIPVVLFMEDYDISREGYHDTHDTLENIDLDYGAAFSAIAVETVARVASSLGK
jgi:Zn-dependent M28 family amino/carboxypeptidase